jgi:hypothetical protein
LRDTFHVDDLIGVTENRQISPAPSHRNLKLARIVMLDFCLVTGVLLSTFCRIQSGSCCSEWRSRKGCFPRFPAECRPCSNADLRGLSGQSNVLTTALIRIWCFSSAILRA